MFKQAERAGTIPLYYQGEEMTTHATLEAFLEKCKDAQQEVANLVVEAREAVEQYERQAAVIYGQIAAIEYLMDYDNNAPVAEVPIVDEETMEDAHKKRLDMFDGITPEEFLEDRKEVVYKKEAMDFVDTIDAINNEESER